MKNRAAPKSIFIGLISLFLAAVLPACKEADSEAPQEKLFGVDYSQEQEFQSPVQVVCNSDSAWTISVAKNDPIHKWSPQTPGVRMEQFEWQSEEGNHDLINISERQGTLYVETRNREDNTLVIRKCGKDGDWGDVMSLKMENWEEYAVMGRGFFVDSKENIYLVSRDEVTCFSGEGQKICGYELKGDVCLWTEDENGHAECVTASSDEIILYELEGNRAEEKWTLKTSAGKACGIQSSEKGTLCLAMDGEILFLDRESGSLLARTDTMKLGVPSVLTGYYDESEGTLQLYGLTGSGTKGLQYSRLSERDASGEQRIELIYGMVGGVNNGDTASIWRAIATFNQTSQDYYVTIKNYDNNIERLHADMAVGNGPDIIDMTYSEYYESYVQNGYLEDLSPYLEQSQYKDDIIWNILDAYRIDGGLYLFTPQVQLWGVMIHPEYEDLVEEWNMETFLELVEQNQWEKDIFDLQGNPQQLLVYYLLSGGQEEFIDWEQRKASFETEEFVDMLELCREYAAEDWPDESGWTSQEREWNSLCMRVPFYLGKYGSGYLSYVTTYGREYPVHGCPTLSGQTYEISACSDSCAIYSGSSKKEGAWTFIESLLWESNQRYSGIANPGIPVRSSVVRELMEESKSVEYKSYTGEILMITDAEIRILEDILYNGKLCNRMLNPDIRLVIEEETAPFFAGDKSAQETARIIQSRVQLILQE